MPAGFQTLNTDANTIQIDQDYRNMFLVSQGVGGTIPPASNYYYPLLALQQPALGTGAYYTFGSAVPSNVRWFIFDVAHPWMGGNAGFQVFDASGQLVFDSSFMPMRIRHYQEVSAAGGLTLEAGRQFATIMGGLAGRWTEGSIKAGGANWRNFEGEEYIGTTCSGGNVFNWDWYWRFYTEWISDTQEYAQGTHVTNYGVPASIMFVDVTNYF